MNNLKTFLLLFIFALFIASCGEDAEDTDDNENTDEEVIENSDEDVEEVSSGAPVVCLWSAISIRKTPDAKAKQITAIYLGEKGTYLGETVVDSTGKGKAKEYIKVKLTDGTTGWIEGRFMAIDAQPYALKESSKLYKRPDILSAGKDEFNRMQYVVILEEQGDWAKVKGIEKSINWYREGWVKKDHLTDDNIDVTVAVLAARAMGKGDKEKKLEALNEILENSDLSSSLFASDVRALVDGLATPQETDEPVEEYEDYGK